MPGPVDTAQIVGDRNLRCGRQIPHAHRRTCHPCAVIDQVIDIIEVAIGKLHSLTQHLAVGRLPVDQSLLHTFVQQRLGDITIKLLVEPRDQPPDFGAIRCRAADHRVGRNGLIDIFADRDRVRQSDVTFRVAHHRRPSGRVHMQKVVALLPRVFANEAVGDAFFPEQQTNFARKGTKRILMEMPHIGRVRAVKHEREGLRVR